MQLRTQTTRHTGRRAPGVGAPGVLLVGQVPASLQALAAHVLAALPQARIEMLASTTELVFGLARQDVAFVIIDSAHLDEAPPSLLRLSRGASAAPRLAFVGGPGASPHAMAADALPAWLRGAGAKGAGAKGAGAKGAGAKGTPCR